MENEVYNQESYIKNILEENERLRKLLEEARANWKQCADNWNEAVLANAKMEKELEDARKNWKESADNWIAAVKYSRELEEKYKQ